MQIMEQLEIKKKLARLKAFTELNPRPVIEIDFDGNIIDQNSSAKTLFPDLKKKGVKHVYLCDLPNIVKSLKKEKKPFRRDIKIKGRWFKQVFYYIPSFNLIHVYGSDATERKQAEEKLKKSELRYRSLFNSMGYGYALQEIIFDKNHKPIDYLFLDVNPAFERFAKVKKEMIVGKTANQLAKSTKTKSNPKIRKDYDRVAITGKPIQFEDYSENLHKYFECYAYKVNENQIALIFSDITARKKVEEEKNNFISIMSHELRNPLMPISANIQFINSILHKNGNVDPQLKESLDIIERQAKNMAQLLDDILDVSKLSHHHFKLEIKIVSVAQIINNATQTVMPLIIERKQTISVKLPEKPIYINVDPLRFEQIIVNLVNNASKYTKAKGHIEIKCQTSGKKLKITVKDNGIGMDAKKIDKIFELFNRSAKPTMGIGGLGIGLNLVKNLITMHGGTIEAKSEGKGKGSEFMLTMPLISQKEGAFNIQVPQKKELDIIPQPSKVLIVDDNKDISTILAKILKQQGHTIKTAGNGQSAVKISEEFKPDVALVDIRMPGMSGYKVAEAIKNQRNTLIALTGYGQDADKQLAKKSGFDYHLTKPVDINYLIKLVGSAGQKISQNSKIKIQND